MCKNGADLDLKDSQVYRQHPDTIIISIKSLDKKFSN